MLRQLLSASVVLGALMFAAPASAQTIRGLRLHVETSLFGIDSSTATAEDADEGNTTTTISFGPGAQGLGFGLGFGINENLVLGANLVLNYTSVKGERGDAYGLVNLTLMPYLEFLFGAGNVRPFIGGALLLELESGEDYGAQYFGLAGLGGVHVFMADSFSLDFSGRLYLEAGSSSQDTGPVDRDTSHLNVGLLVLVGVSGWGI